MWCSIELDVNGRIAEETSDGTTRRMKQTACMTSLTQWFEVRNCDPIHRKVPRIILDKETIRSIVKDKTSLVQ